MSKNNFDKFINKEPKGAKKKEKIKQEKKVAKKEREAYFIEKKREQRAAKKLQNENNSSFVKKSADRFQPTSTKKTFSKEKTGSTPPPAQGWKKDGKAFKARPESTFDKSDKNKKPYKANANDEQQAFKPKTKFAEPVKGAKPKTDRPFARKDQKPWEQKVERFTKKTLKDNVVEKPAKKEFIPKTSPVKREAAVIPLNKFIAHGGVCSRRDAGEMVKAGKVKVNGETIIDPGYKVGENDTVIANGKKVLRQKNLVYILLNKPKDFITTVDDPQGRKTVLDIVRSATEERIYPVGRLDRNTSGVLLLTNDGELAQQLTHPSFEVRKIYEVKLDKPLTKSDFEKLIAGVKLEDGEVHADSLAYGDAKDKSIIGIEIHSGKNRVVRRMFEYLGYQVKNLDRVMFANLTKKNVERGKWRFLSEKEVRLLKFFNKSKR